MTGQPEPPVERPRLVRVPFERVPGWVTRYGAAHLDTRWVVGPDAVVAQSPDGARARIAVPFAPLPEPSLDALYAHLERAWRIGMVLVRRGGFAVVRLEGPTVADSKIGRRHVQGRTKAGGWSQQRFARRRDNQARAAFDAAAEHVERLLAPHAGSLHLLASGGDRQAVASVLAHPQLARLAALPQTWLGGVPDPNRTVVDAAITDVRSVDITLTP
jgi:Actinobacteria/chloroflexi VLRF1 release factor